MGPLHLCGAKALGELLRAARSVRAFRGLRSYSSRERRCKTRSEVHFSLKGHQEEIGERKKHEKKESKKTTHGVDSGSILFNHRSKTAVFPGFPEDF